MLPMCVLPQAYAYSQNSPILQKKSIFVLHLYHFDSAWTITGFKEDNYATIITAWCMGVVIHDTDKA